ncbi:SDR family oxidoreductase [Kluyvera sichuanensis]|uniref:SDR family oxidoreductase n=1 Tax=Kluyvera sichuanensis TaxID=2725494 RepID=UPI0039F56F4E
MPDNIIIRDNVAVITGAAHGLGAAMARHFAAEGMQLSLFDRDEQALLSLSEALAVKTCCTVGDVASNEDLQTLYNNTMSEFGRVSLLVNNAAVNTGAGPWGEPGLWLKHLQTNLLSAVTLQYLFVPGMLSHDAPAAVVNLGSKEGITTPPGNAAYSAGKAAIKVLTEQLAHELLQVAGDRVTAHLLIPGYTWTPMNFPGMDEKTDNKPEAVWTADQVIDYFKTCFTNGDFYILCPDNEVTPEMDAKRIAWASQDIIENRPALSRWHPDWKNQFDSWMKNKR